MWKQRFILVNQETACSSIDLEPRRLNEAGTLQRVSGSCGFWFAEGGYNRCNFAPGLAGGFLFPGKVTMPARGHGEGDGMKRIGVIGAVLEKPRQSQAAFNETVAAFRGIIKGRMGIPFDDDEVSVISLTVMGELDQINALTGKLGNLPNVTVKTAVSNVLKSESGDAE